jgi:hypothetical protein
MRVTSELFVSALLRRVFGSGGYGAVLRRGATEAGAVFITVRDRLGEVGLFGPAEQTAYEGARPDDRMFRRRQGTTEEAARQILDRELKFDPDIWIVEVEPGAVKLEDLIEIRTE